MAQKNRTSQSAIPAHVISAKLSFIEISPVTLREIGVTDRRPDGQPENIMLSHYCCRRHNIMKSRKVE